MPGKVQKGPTDDFKAFEGIFKPFGEKNEAGEKLRATHFKLADPNGNGLCSLAELETWVLARLMEKYPKDKTKKDHRGDPLEYGKDLFEAFRPSYIRAFNDAKDYKADSGAVLEGTKTSTADDFVSKGEFRLFNAYLCVYGAMFDAFAKIDGGGAGRDAGDDRRMELKEWLAGYKGAAGYGFGCLDGIKDDKAATALFKKMDSDGAGMVLLGEFSDFIKNEEIKAGTAVGKLLDEDEAPPEGGFAPVKSAGPGGSAPGPSQEFIDFKVGPGM